MGKWQPVAKNDQGRRDFALVRRLGLWIRQFFAEHRHRPESTQTARQPAAAGFSFTARPRPHSLPIPPAGQPACCGYARSCTYAVHPRLPRRIRFARHFARLATALDATPSALEPSGAVLAFAAAAHRPDYLGGVPLPSESRGSLLSGPLRLCEAFKFGHC